MTKQEQELVLSLTALETAIARLLYYEDQEDSVAYIVESFKLFKGKFYSISLDKENAPCK